MKLDAFKKLAVGDRIEFRSITRHNTRKATRKITGFSVDHDYDNLDADGQFPRSTELLKVRFEGTDGFYVRRHEIIRKIS